MREFYDACEAALCSKRADSAAIRLRMAYDIMQPIIERAKARLELRLVADLVAHLEWTATRIGWLLSEGEGKWPGFGPLGACLPGTSLVFTQTRQKGSLDYRWSHWKELPESILPQVAMRSGWPVDRLDEESIEFAR